MDKTLMAAVNTTEHFLGIFGMGITQGNFESTVARSPITVAVQEYGLIPSYSYGYTAGAHYRNMPASVTLGGYDAARFVDHNNDFTVSKSDSLLRTLVRGIQVSSAEGQVAPEEWGSDTQLLSQMNTSFTALIDTSIPFLYLPNKVCDAFAEALNMTYHDSIDLYGLSNDQYQDFRSKDSFSFTFSFSSTDNNDNFGEPLNVPGVVNITIPMQAFVSTVEYPFYDEAIEYGEPAQPYFSLRRSGDNETFIIGRSFFQEAYLLTQFDKQVFSIHSALFPSDPIGEADIESLVQPDNSPYPPPAATRSHGLSKGEIAGIVVGASAAVVVAVIVVGCCWRRRRNTRIHGVVPDSEGEKRSTTSVTPEPVQSNSPLSRVWAKLARRNRSKSKLPSSPGDASQPLEAPNTQVYELPVPAEPVELHANDDHDVAEDGDLGLQGQPMSAYEQQRLRLDRQLAGPVPEYTPPENGPVPPSEKTAYHYEARTVPERRAVPERCPVPSHGSVSPQAPDSNNSNSMPSNESMVSPVSPGSGWANKSDNYSPNNTPTHSPMAPDAPPNPLSSQQPRSLHDVHDVRESSGVSERSASPSSINIYPSNIQRTPIDPSKVVCLGPLPENVHLREPSSVPQIMGPDGTRLDLPGFNAEHREEYESTLGSNYTEEEEKLKEHQAQLASSQPAAQGSMAPHPLSQSYSSNEDLHSPQEHTTWLQAQGYYAPTPQPHSTQTQSGLPHPQSHTYHHEPYSQPQPYQPEGLYQSAQEQHQLSQWQLAAQAGKQRLQEQWQREEEMRRLVRVRASQQQNQYHAPSHVEHPLQMTHYAQTSGATYIPGRDASVGGGEMEFIHVPQPAEKRFSWEEDRSTY